MSLKTVLEKLKLEPYVLALFGMVVLASILPVRGETAHGLNVVVKLAIALLFERFTSVSMAEGLSDDAAVESAIEAAYQLGGDGVHCAYKEVQAVAREALGERS